MIHVLPVNDIKEHTEDTTCECNPKVEIHENDILVIHNAFDHRELIEQVEEILKDDFNESSPNIEFYT